MTGRAPERDGFFNEPCPLIMLGKALGLGVYQFGGTGFERLCDLWVPSLRSAAQQAAASCSQRVLEAVDRFGRRAAFEDQLGSDEPAKSGLQIVFGKAGDGAQQRVG